ncbi:hypothetical protein P154DRAFT_337182 [Amniculicola lignicola CBS 123094]|uniref:Uncharacterized protein n=1 Tax=Amniculicola lignicola CBS 123094 TaxID=1392246 RepID=A0A6A5WUV9_9PLEO|nr:hypothetical protein P154DRAFT_337182 [Amniculicola lignicola CBS 123094]
MRAAGWVADRGALSKCTGLIIVAFCVSKRGRRCNVQKRPGLLPMRPCCCILRITRIGGDDGEVVPELGGRVLSKTAAGPLHRVNNCAHCTEFARPRIGKLSDTLVLHYSTIRAAFGA